MLFLKNNWKAILFPFSCLIILIVDQIILQISLMISLVKIGIISLLHAMFVLKTKYVYNSDIYNYIYNLRIELNKNSIIKPFLKTSQSMYIFWLYFFLVTLFLSNFAFVIPYRKMLLSLITVLTIIVFMDCINEIFRAIINKADLNRVYTPHSLKQTRFMWKAIAKIMPACISFGKLVTATLVGTEVVGPSIVGDGQLIGPVTKTVVNNHMYPNCEVPLETRYDVQYESYKERWNSDVDKGLRPENNRMPERIYTINCKKDMLNLGLTSDMIDSLSTSQSITTPGKK